MAKTTTDISERMAVLERSLAAICAYVSETHAIVDGVLVESASVPEPVREDVYACSCVGGKAEHTHIPTSATGSACVQYVLANPSKFNAEALVTARDLVSAPEQALPASTSAPPAAATSKPTNAELRAAVVAARADASNLANTKQRGLKADVKRQMAAGFGIKPSAVGWMDWAIRTKGA